MSHHSLRVVLVALLAAAPSSLFVAPVVGQVTNDQAAEMALNSARKAFNEKDYLFARDRFKEFVQRYGGHKQVNSARFGLALTLIEGPERNYEEARNLLRSLAQDGNFPDRHLAQYYLALATRGLGMKDLSDADAHVNEAGKYHGQAKHRFEEALPLFKAALAGFQAKAKDAKPGEKGLPADLEWVARARCDVAEMELRLNKGKDAQATALPFLADPVLTSSRYRDLGRYHYGHACLLVKDPVRAQKALALLAPFRDPAFGTHSCYLLARAHHLADERTEAAAHYEETIADFTKAKEQAIELLKQPEKFKNDPDERQRLEALARGQAPDHVARAGFYLAVLQYEAGKFGEAKGRLQDFLKAAPATPMRNEVELRIGFCQVQLKEYAEAQRTLTPLIDREPKLADQVLLWIGKAQAGAAPEASANQGAHDQAIQNALNSLRAASDRAQQLASTDPDAKARRAEILLEMGDQMQQVKLYRDAANLYSQLISDKSLPERGDELQQRLAAALNLAGDYNESDKVCERFLDKNGKSPLAPALLFTYAENSYFRSLASEKSGDANERKQAPAQAAQAVQRLQKLLEKYPEYPKVGIARYTLGLTLYRQGELDKAQKALAEIPDSERNGDLALTGYLVADCLLRQVPVGVPEDALQAGKMEEQLKNASDLLESFVSANPKNPQLPDALLKYGLTQQRLASLLAQPPEKAKAVGAARSAYERVLHDFSKDPAAPQALLERAKCIAQTGDMNQASHELRRFLSPPFNQTPPAPMALVQLASYLRDQHKGADAAAVLQTARDQYEGPLSGDPERSKWVAILRYQHGLALREAGKLPEARKAFDAAMQAAGDRPEAVEAALRLGQCIKEEGQQRVEQAQKLRSGNRKEDLPQVQRLSEEGYKIVREAVQFLESQYDVAKKREAQPEARARMLYDTAWAYRTLAEAEIETARTALAKEIAKDLGPGAAKFPPPTVATDKVPLQPAEKKALGLYKTLVADFADLPIATEARFELAELLSQRGQYDQAVQLLNDVLDKEPAPELTEKVRLRLGGIHAAKGNLKAALGQFDTVLQNPKATPTLAGWAQYRAGEALIAAEQYAEAAKRLVFFRDQGPYQNLPGLTDRAMLRLGFAFAQQKDWGQSRGALERVTNNFSNSPWVDEARYGIGWAYQQERNYDAAVTAYSQVTAHTAAEIAAKAQLQIGQCRMEQNRHLDAANAFLVVSFTYDYPELNAAALLEAARAYGELQLQDSSQRLLQRIVREFPNTPWAEAAQERLGPQRPN